MTRRTRKRPAAPWCGWVSSRAGLARARALKRKARIQVLRPVHCRACRACPAGWGRAGGGGGGPGRPARGTSRAGPAPRPSPLAQGLGVPCGARGMGALHNSHHSLRSFTSNRCNESDHEACCAAAHTAALLGASAGPALGVPHAGLGAATPMRGARWQAVENTEPASRELFPCGASATHHVPQAGRPYTARVPQPRPRPLRWQRP